MDRIFRFRSAVVSSRNGHTCVRFWARTVDSISLQGGELGKKAYLADADIILLVEGPQGSPDFSQLDVGPQTFEGPSVEVIFRGACTVDSSESGLVVVVPEGKLTVIRDKGLPFTEEILQQVETFDFDGPVSIEHDVPPHRVPPGQQQRLRS